MRILVTGGAGYIGSHAVYQLKELGYSPVVVDDLSTGNKIFVPNDIPFYKNNLDSISDLKELLLKEKVEAVLHFAASISTVDSVNNPLKYYQNNTFNTANLLKAMIDCRVYKLIFSSTAAVYGQPTSYKPVKENYNLSPINPYGQSKLFSEKIIQDLCKVSPLQAICLRYFNVAGADEQLRTGQSNKNASHLIKKCVNVALGLEPYLSVFGTDFNTPDGTGVRDYIHVSDLIDIHILALESIGRNTQNFETFNCGYGEGLSVYDITRGIEKEIGSRLNLRIEPRRDGDTAFVVADCSKIANELKWTPKRNDLTKILRSAYDWQKFLLEQNIE